MGNFLSGAARCYFLVSGVVFSDKSQNREDIVDVTYCHLCANQSLIGSRNKGSFFFLWLANLNNKSSVCKQISSLLCYIYLHAALFSSPGACMTSFCWRISVQRDAFN